jgi:hypothetical protein
VNIAVLYPEQRRGAPAHSPRSPAFCEGGHPSCRIPLTPFRMNTCKSVTKQTTLSPFRMNTYAKTGGGVPYLRIARNRRNAPSPLLPITSLQPLQFQAITHSLAQRRHAKPFRIKSLRTLFIATGVVPLTLLRKNKTPRVESGDHSTPGRGQL